MMAFCKIECTGELLDRLPGAADLENDIGRNPIGEICVADLDNHAALFPHPLHHATYPDQRYTLAAFGHTFRVWENVRSTVEGNRVLIYVDKQTEYLEDGILIEVVRSAFAAWQHSGDTTLHYAVVNRTPPPKPPRSPQEVMVCLNKAFLPFTPAASELARDHFVPLLVREDEFEAFVSHGRKTDWKGLNAGAMEVVSDAIARIEHKTKQP